jgi:HK97 family phage major capsid protein
VKYLEELRAVVAAKLEERKAAQAALDNVLAIPTAEGRSELTDAENLEFVAKRDVLKALDQEIDTLEERVADLTAEQERRDNLARVSAQVPAVGGAKVISEARTYNPQNDKRGHRFFADVASRQYDPDAAERLARHMNEERLERQRDGRELRAVGTSAFVNLVVPQYLTDMVAPKRKAMRPLANIANAHPLPAQGMTVEISRITTGSSVAVQATQNSAVSETNMDDTALSIAVKTSAGQQTASRQAIDRGAGIDDVIIQDLLGALETNIDNTLITEATTGLDAVTDANLDVAYTDASPTAAELWPKLFDAVQQVQTNHFGGVSHFLMHPRRFWWLASQVGTNFPFVNLTGAGPQAGGSVTTAGYGDGPSGYLAGLPVIVDANVATNLGAGTNEDAIYAVSADEVHLWEDDTTYIRTEEVNASTLGVLFVVFRYWAYTVSRYPNAHARINGTGLITPTF